jgi:hypothetical protein
MKTKYLILLILTITVFIVAGVPAMGQNKSATTDTTKQDTIIYTCNMHPEIQANQPGTCPKCGMALVQIRSSSPEHKMDMTMCSMHGMVDMNHKHDEQKKNNMKLTKGMGIGMGIMMIVMLVFLMSR